MPKAKATSPARSQGGITTPKRKTTRGSRSLCSPALSTASGRLTSLADQFKDKHMESFALSPLNGRSVLNDNTEIEEPRRKSWWKKLDENSQDVMEILEDNRLTVNNAIEEFIDIDVLSQEKKNYTLDLPESSDNESIKSIVLPQRRLFTQKENQPQKKYGHLIDNRESLAKLHKTNTANIDKTVNVGTRDLFQNAMRSKPIFPAALLNISPNKTAADKTRENVLVDPKPRVRNIFGNRPANKRKNMFADFIIASESEDEIPEIQPKVFSFQKKLEQRRISSVSKGRDASPASSITTDIEMDFRMLLPSSTMVENQLEDNMLAENTPIKRARLSKLSEAKESEAGTLQTNTTSDKTKQSNKSVASKNKSKASPEIKDKSLNSSRTTRSMMKNASKRDENVNTPVKQDTKGKDLDVSKSKSDIDKHNTSLNKSQKQNKTRNSPKAKVTEIESEEIVVNAINNVTRVINKSTNKSLPNTTATNTSVNEKERTVTLKVHDKLNKTGSNDAEQNEQEDDENNFTLEYDEVLEVAEIHNNLNENQKENTKKRNTVVLEKESQETEINNSKSNKSRSTNKSFQQKTAKIVEESVESQTEQYSAVDNVDGNQEQETDNVQNKDEEMINEEIEEDASNSREDMSDGKAIEENAQENEIKINVSQDNEEEANESEENEDEVNVSQENEEEMNESQEKAANESQEVENEVSEGEDEEEANESDENEDEANGSDVNEDEANESQEIEEEANESQEIEIEANESVEDEEERNYESQEIEEEANESQEDVEQANESQKAEEEAIESQEDEEEANESQEAEEEAIESQEIVDAHVSDGENDDGMDENEEGTANESQVNEASANESQEIENDEENNHEVASEAESEEVEDDQHMDDSDEADNAIASDPEISDDNQADEMEVDGDEEQESDNESEQNEHESHEERQIEKQNEIVPSEEIDESPNITHDTTGRHRKKHLDTSPEVILHDNNNTNQMDSFTAKGRNTSVRKTKSMIKNMNIRPSLAPPRDSIGFSDGTRNSSAEGSGWDSHRTTRKTLRQTFGKDFTPRKSLRALVMEKSAKRQTDYIETHSETVKFPLANSTEMPEDSNHHVEDIVESDHEVSRRTRLTTLEMYLQKIKEQNIEERLKMEAAVRNSFKNPVSNSLSLFKVPNKPAPRRAKPTQSKPKKQLKSIIPFELPSEVIEDMKYKPPKRFRPTNASWITKRLYKFLEDKLETKYDYKARVRAEKLVETIYNFAKDLRRHNVAPTDAVDVLKHELARLEIVRTHFEFYEFFNDFMPREVRIKVVPDIVNKIALPRHGVFSDILRGNTVQG